MKQKKLTLNKVTVSHLGRNELKGVVAGEITIGPCAYTVVGCETAGLGCPPSFNC
jgi:hypothetical protein